MCVVLSLSVMGASVAIEAMGVPTTALSEDMIGNGETYEPTTYKTNQRAKTAKTMASSRPR